MKTIKKIGLVLMIALSLVVITGCNLDPGKDPKDDPIPENPEDFGTPEDTKVLESGKKYEIIDGKTIIVPKNSKILKVIEEGGKKYLATLTAGKEVGLETTKAGKKTVFEYDVQYRIVSFSRGHNLTNYESGNLFDNYLRKVGLPYTVGSDNPYLMDIAVSAAILDESYQTKVINLTNDFYDLDYQLKENDEDLLLDTYASVSKEGIQFTEAAVGKTLTIIASLKSDTLTLPEIQQTVVVEPGLNVNTNQELKEAFSDLNVHQIHIHRDIVAELNEDQLFELGGKKYPYNFNKIETEEDRGFHGNVYRRYHAESIGELTINGNFFTVDASNVPLLTGDGEGQAGYVDENNTIISSQSAIFRFGTSTSEYSSNNWVKFKNLTVYANTNRPDPEDLSLSGGHSGLRNDKADLIIDNVNIEYAVCGIFSVYIPAKTYIIYSNISNSWASNLLMWGSAYTEIENSYLSNSGSAAISVVDSEAGDGQSGLENYLDPELVINNSTILNLTSGTSPWFRAYKLSSISTMVSGIDYSLQGVNGASGGLLDITLFGEKESNQEDSQFNFAIMIQNANPLSPNSGPYSQAKVTIDGVSVYRPYNYKVSNPLIGAVCQAGAVFSPFGYDIAEAMNQILMSNTTYQQIMATGTTAEKEAVLSEIFATSFIQGMLNPSDVNPKYAEMMPADFNVTAIVEIYPNKK